MALKIYAQYQEKTIEYVKENPYRLVEEIDGIGFSTADKIANRMGISKDSPFRFRAGILHLLGENSDKNGNTYIHKNALLENLATLLEVDTNEYFAEFIKVLDNLAFDKVITILRKNQAEIVMLTKMYFTESSVAK